MNLNQGFSRPMFNNLFRCQIQYFAQEIIICKRWLVLGNLPERVVQTSMIFVYDFPDSLRVCVKRGVDLPVVFPAFPIGMISLSFINGLQQNHFQIYDGLIKSRLFGTIHKIISLMLQ